MDTSNTRLPSVGTMRMDCSKTEAGRYGGLMCRYSIVVPTRDRPRLLRRAVDSALKGLAADGEILIIDDRSATPAKVALSGLTDSRIRIVRLSEGQTGVSAARNAGIDHARGDVVFFLDDDDEILPDYCERILANGVTRHDYGFSSYLQVNDLTNRRRSARARFDEGTIPLDAPLGKRLCGFGMGFWIWRHVAVELGPVSEALSTNEDTEYLCRLIQAGKMGWYSALPGVVLHAHDGPGPDVDHLTKRASAYERARCMRALCDLYPDMAVHLGRGYIRHCLKTDVAETAWQFIASQGNWRVRNKLRLFAVTKMIAYRIAGKIQSGHVTN